MIIVTKKNSNKNKVDNLISKLLDMQLEVKKLESKGTEVICVFGDTYKIDSSQISSLDFVQSLKRISTPYKLVGKDFRSNYLSININGNIIGNNNFQVIAGPCSIESKSQLEETGNLLKETNTAFLRGGAYKPRSSPYSFQGKGKQGIDYLVNEKKRSNLSIITEIVDIRDIDNFKDIDIIQVGSRNMQNYELLKELGQSNKTILLKRGYANTLDELLMSAEYVVAGGNNNIILCERGIRTFNNSTRNTLDLSAISVLKDKTYFPIIVDPSHGTGNSKYVIPMSMAAAAAGADGLIIEVHKNKEEALSDGMQSLDFNEYKSLIKNINNILPYAYKY